MAGSSSEESGVGRPLEGMSKQQLSGEALAEWRSSEQVENGITSTSPPYWDTDDGEDCDAGPKPSELYGKYTWKIDKFSQINKRELRSNAFEVGGYKWYILIYPQGCDVCNHLSLFLCVANHDKLLPGWSHFAQFTIAVVNKDPKKSKYSDTLHRFWKKEHDWGWKKFMELSKVLDGFVDGDTLIIKAQVQVIRERPDRPFRCLDCQYRRELVRVYLSNVEQICRRFVEERRGRLGKLIEDKVRWSSLCSFWIGIDETGRRRMSREKSDLILKVAVKQFFIEKEVTSTLVMDSLYSGLKALEARSQSKSKKAEEPLPIVRVEKDTFILVDDVLLLLERAALEPLPPKDEKGPQNRTKDGGSGEDFSKDSIERDERRLTELGRRTIEIFVLAHIFSKIEIAYQEAVALKRQEELIREEEAAWMTGIEQKVKHGASEKEKKSKKKQGKQKRNNNRKAKDKGKEEKAGGVVAEETLVQPADSDDRDSSSPLNWDTNTPTEPSSSVSASHINNNNNNNNNNNSSSNDNNNINGERKSSSSATAMDDSSSSTCSTDSLPSVMMNPPYKGQKSQKSFTRGKDKAHLKVGGKYNQVDEESDVVVSLKDRMKWLQQHMEEVVSLQKEVNGKDEVDHVETSLKEKTGLKTSPFPLKKNAPAFARKPPTDKDKANSGHKNGTQEKPSTTDKPPVVHQVPRPSVSMVQSSPFLSRSVSADQSFVPQSYRNVMMRNTLSQPPPPTFLLPQTTSDTNNSFRPQMGMMLNDIQNPPDEFPHLDIINDLLDDATEFQRPHQLTRQFTYPGGDMEHGHCTSNSCRSERIQSYYDEFQHSYDLSREMMVPQPYMNGHINNQWLQQQQQPQMDHLSYLGLRNMDNDGYQYPHYSNLLMGVNAYTVYPPSNGH